jgi:hypothetical protein
MPQPLPTVTPTPVSPESSSGPLPSPGDSSSAASWRQLIGHALTSALAIITVVKVLSWFPQCLAMVRLPAGGVSHDPWSWAPLVLDLGAAIAVAAPVSFRSLLELAKNLRLPKS